MRWIGPLVVAIGAVGLYLTAGTALAEWRSAQFSRLSEVQNEIAVLETRQAGLRADLANFSDQDITDLFWTAGQPGAATALVQSAISSTASQHGILMRSITPFTPREETIQGAFGVRLEFEARLDQLSQFLQSIEYDRPALVVDRMVLRRLNRPGDTAAQPSLFAQIDLLAPVILTGEGVSE